MHNFNFQKNNVAVNCLILLAYLLYKEGEPFLSEAVKNYINNLLNKENKAFFMHFLRLHIDQLMLQPGPSIMIAH